MTIKTASITAQNTFTDPIVVGEGDYIDVAIAGTFSATVTVQRRRSDYNSNAWNDMPTTYTAATQTVIGPVASNWEYRIGVKTGDFTSGTAIVALSAN